MHAVETLVWRVGLVALLYAYVFVGGVPVVPK